MYSATASWVASGSAEEVRFWAKDGVALAGGCTVPRRHHASPLCCTAVRGSRPASIRISRPGSHPRIKPPC